MPEGGVTWQQRVPVIIAHGLAHLVGHTHEEDADHHQMQACEQSLLRLALNSAHMDAVAKKENRDATNHNCNHSCAIMSGLEMTCRAGCADRAVEVGLCCPECVAVLQQPPLTSILKMSTQN